MAAEQESQDAQISLVLGGRRRSERGTLASACRKKCASLCRNSARAWIASRWGRRRPRSPGTFHHQIHLEVSSSGSSRGPISRLRRVFAGRPSRARWARTIKRAMFTPVARWVPGTSPGMTLLGVASVPFHHQGRERGAFYATRYSRRRTPQNKLRHSLCPLAAILQRATKKPHRALWQAVGYHLPMFSRFRSG